MQTVQPTQWTHRTILCCISKALKQVAKKVVVKYLLLANIFQLAK